MSRNEMPPNFFNIDNPFLWIEANIRDNSNWASLFATTIWLLWKGRNEMTFNSRNNLPSIPRCVTQLLLALNDARNRRCRSEGLAATGPAKWRPPGCGWTKLNVDGSASGNPGSIAGGGVFRDEQGRVSMAFAFKGQDGSALLSEFLACRRGLQLARELEINKLCVESDCLEVVKALEDREINAHRYYNIIQRCWNLVDSTPWEVKFQHCPRSCNSLADALAKFGQEVNETEIYFNYLPMALADIPAKDNEHFIM